MTDWLIDWLIHTRFLPSVWTAMPEWPSFGTSCRTASTSGDAPHFITLVWPATSATERSGFHLRIYTYPLTEVLCLWLWYKALTRRPTVLLYLRSLDTWWAKATVKPCCNSAGLQERFTVATFLLCDHRSWSLPSTNPICHYNRSRAWTVQP